MLQDISRLLFNKNKTPSKTLQTWKRKVVTSWDPRSACLTGMVCTGLAWRKSVGDWFFCACTGKSASRSERVWCCTVLLSVLLWLIYGQCLANFKTNSFTCIANIRACGKLKARNILIGLKRTLLRNIWQQSWKKFIPTPTKKKLSRK
jgi:nicotinamide riboside transporter PnuC